MKQALVRGSQIIEKKFAKEFARALTTNTERSSSKQQNSSFNNKNKGVDLLDEKFRGYQRCGSKTAQFLISSGMGVAGVITSRKIRENIRDNVKQGVQQNTTESDENENKRSNASKENEDLKEHYVVRTKHDYTISTEKLNSIHDEFTSFFDKLDEHPIIKDVLEIAAKEDRLNLIHLHGEKHPDPEEKDTLALHDEGAKAIHIYNINNPKMTPDVIISAFVHECGHAVQNILLETKHAYENPFENGSLICSLREDLHFSGYKNQKNEFESEIDGYPKSEHSYEGHSRYLQELLKNKKVAEDMFPSTTQEVKSIHRNMKTDLENKTNSYTQRVEESRLEQLCIDM